MSIMIDHRPNTPNLGAIATYWHNLGRHQFEKTFPYAKVLAIDWGEPSCLRCGWLAPVKEYCDFPEQWKPARRFRAAWNGSCGWLEICHLHDHARGGTTEPSNLVPMCPLCHADQPECLNREDGIAYVNSMPVRRRVLAPLVQLYTDNHYRGRKPASSKDALRLLQKAYAEVGMVYSCVAQQR